MKRLLYQLRYFLIISSFFIGTGLFFLVWTSKVESHLSINSTHTPFQDFFFKYYTYVGDGVFVAITTALISFFLFKKHGIKYVLLGALTLIMTGVVVQSLKQLVFYDAFRPIKFLSSYSLYRVPGVELHISNSFPSGHTAAAFGFFAFVAFILRKWPLAQFFSVIAAVLVGYSRIYLSQHFLEDTVFGATLGVLCFLVSYALLYKKFFTKTI